MPVTTEMLHARLLAIRRDVEATLVMAQTHDVSHGMLAQCEALLEEVDATMAIVTRRLPLSTSRRLH